MQRFAQAGVGHVLYYEARSESLHSYAREGGGDEEAPMAEYP